MANSPYDMGFVYCLTCEAERNEGEYECLGLVPEHGSTKYRCLICGDAFERIPPSFVLPPDACREDL
jgi:hypothetical protein